MRSLDPKLFLFIVLAAAGLCGAVLTSLFGRQENTQHDGPNPLPFVGFLFGSILGGLVIFLWRHFH